MEASLEPAVYEFVMKYKSDNAPFFTVAMPIDRKSPLSVYEYHRPLATGNWPLHRVVTSAIVMRPMALAQVNPGGASDGQMS